MNLINQTKSKSKPPAAKKAKKNLTFSLLCPEEPDVEDDEYEIGSLIENEIKLYRKLKAVNLNDLSCPLEFYKLNQTVLPNLSKIIEMVFCVMASSVPSEQTFSASGLLISNLRTGMDPELVQELMILSRN